MLALYVHLNQAIRLSKKARVDIDLHSDSCGMRNFI
jgi:hypothetical protein